MDAEVVSALNEIKVLIVQSNPVWLPAFFTLIGTVAGAFVVGFWQYKNGRLNIEQLRNSKELEIKSEVVSKQRQQWMDQLRQLSSEFMADLDIVVSDMGVNAISREQHAVIYRNISTKGTIMFLMLNPNKPDQNIAMQSLSNLQVLSGIEQEEGVEVAQQKYEEYKNELTQSLLAIFGETWRKIKRFE